MIKYGVIMKNISVFAVLTYNNQIILCRRNYGNFNWTLPGGSIELGECVVDALKREVFEETGQSIDSCKYILTSYSKEKYSVAFIYFIKLNSLDKFSFDSNELQDVQLFNLFNLPDELSLRQKKWIELCFNESIYDRILYI